MTVYVITSLKAGSGKTTLAMHLCERLIKRGSVILLNADISTAHFEWAQQHNARLGFEHLEIKENDAEVLDKRLMHLQRQYQNIVVDIAGHDCKALRCVLKQADKMLIPTATGENDLKLVSEMLQLAISIRQFNTQLQVFVVFNKLPVETSANEIEQSKQLLQELPSAHFLNTIIYEHNDFEHAMQNSSCIWQHNNEQGQRLEQLMMELLPD